MTITRTYSRTAGQLIAEALRDAKIIASEQPISDSDYSNGLTSLNNVGVSLQTEGLHLWLMERAVLPLNTGQQVYELGPDGDPCGYEDTFVYTALSASAAASATTLTVDSTFGMEAAPGILESSPVVSTQDWSATDATLSISSGLVITNVGANDGYADYALPATVGQTYRVRFTFTKGTSAGCTFSVLNGTTVEDSETLVATASGELTITAAVDPIIFRAQNTSIINGQTSTVAALQYVDDKTGSRIGIQLTNGARFWTYVLDVDSDTSVDITDPLTSAAASGNTVYSYVNQIDRPLQLFNATYLSSVNQSEIPVNRWSRQEYTQQPVKNSQGTVVNWYYNPTLNDGKLYVWQTANNVENMMKFDVRRPMAIYNDISDVLAFPVEYYMYFKWAIAADLGPSYGVKDNRQIVMEQKAAKYLELALGNDNELDSMFLAPNWSGG